MGRRVDRIRVEITMLVDGFGYQNIVMDYDPEEDDPLVELALAVNRERVRAAILAAGPDPTSVLF